MTRSPTRNNFDLEKVLRHEKHYVVFKLWYKISKINKQTFLSVLKILKRRSTQYSIRHWQKYWRRSESTKKILHEKPKLWKYQRSQLCPFQYMWINNNLNTYSNTGCKFNNQLDYNQAVRTRIEWTRLGFIKMKSLFCNSSISSSLRYCLLRCNVSSILYATEDNSHHQQKCLEENRYR